MKIMQTSKKEPHKQHSTDHDLSMHGKSNYIMLKLSQALPGGTAVSCGCNALSLGEPINRPNLPKYMSKLYLVPFEADFDIV